MIFCYHLLFETCHFTLWCEMVNAGKKVDGQDESGDTAMEGAEAA